MRWTGYVACVGTRECIQDSGGGNLKERDHLEDKGVDVRK